MHHLLRWLLDYLLLLLLDSELLLGMMDLRLLNVLLGLFLNANALGLLLWLLLHLLDLLLMGGRLVDHLGSELLHGMTLRLDMFVNDLMLLGLLVLLRRSSMDNLVARLVLQNDLRGLLVG